MASAAPRDWPGADPKTGKHPQRHPGTMPTLARALARYAALTVAVDFVVLAGLGVLGLLRGWSTREAWGEGLIWSGLAAAAIGGLAVSGAWQGRMIGLSYAASTSAASLEERTRTVSRDVVASYRRLLFLLAVAAPLVAAGLWLDPRV